MSAATSKMLSAAVNLDLFVMWDCAIQSGYCVGRNGCDYAHVFLPEMQMIAKHAIDESMNREGLSYGNAIESFTASCSNNNSLAKIIDECDYMKYTKSNTVVIDKKYAQHG